MEKMITEVTSKKSGRTYQVEMEQYGTRNRVYNLYCGSILLARTDSPRRHPDPRVAEQPSISIEQAIEIADIRAEEMKLVVRPAAGYKGME